MIKIKTHDGPARLGSEDEKITPTLLNYKNLITTPSIKTPFKIQKEIAKENVDKTIKLSDSEKDKTKIGIIQGAQYTDLRVKCAKELEEKGFSKLMFANSDDMMRNPELMLDIIINVRESLNPNTTLYFPFATTQIIPILAYLGIDAFDTSRAEYETLNKNIMSSDNIYPSQEYELADNILEYNLKQVEFTILEVQQNIKNKTLRNLVEQKACTNPELMTLLRLLDKNYQSYLQKYTQLY